MLSDMEPIYREFGRRLRQARMDAALTQHALGKRVGLGRTSITNIEQGNQHVGLHLLYQLANALGLAPGDLLPQESDLGGGGEVLETVLVRMGRADRTRIERDMEQLRREDRERILRLVREEEGMDDRR